MRGNEFGKRPNRLRGESGQAGFLTASAAFLLIAAGAIGARWGMDRGADQEAQAHCPAPIDGYGLEDQSVHTYDDLSTEGIDLTVMNDGKRLRFMGPAVKSEVLVAGLGEGRTQYSFDTDSRFPDVFVETWPVDYTHESKALNVTASRSNC